MPLNLLRNGELTFEPMGLEPFITTYVFLTAQYRLGSQAHEVGMK